MEKIKNISKEYGVYLLIFIVFLIIGLFVPTGGDDWEISSWYSNEGLFGLLIKSIYAWTNFTGRIMNNFFDMFLSKYPLLWAFVSAFIHVGTIYFILKLFKNEKNKLLPFIMLVLFLSVSTGFRAEIQLHKIGNISYTIPTFSIIFALYYLNKHLNVQKDELSLF